MPVAKGQKGIAQEMRKFSKGKLHSGAKTGPVVTNPKQAKAIAMRASGMPKPGRKGAVDFPMAEKLPNKQGRYPK